MPESSRPGTWCPGRPGRVDCGEFEQPSTKAAAATEGSSPTSPAPAEQPDQHRPGRAARPDSTQSQPTATRRRCRRTGSSPPSACRTTSTTCPSLLSRLASRCAKHSPSGPLTRLHPARRARGGGLDRGEERLRLYHRSRSAAKRHVVDNAAPVVVNSRRSCTPSHHVPPNRPPDYALREGRLHHRGEDADDVDLHSVGSSAWHTSPARRRTPIQVAKAGHPLGSTSLRCERAACVRVAHRSFAWSRPSADRRRSRWPWIDPTQMRRSGESAPLPALPGQPDDSVDWPGTRRVPADDRVVRVLHSAPHEVVLINVPGGSGGIVDAGSQQLGASEIVRIVDRDHAIEGHDGRPW